MESQYLQNIRYKLQKRVRTLNGAELELFLYRLKAFWVFFDESPLLTALARELLARAPDLQETLDRLKRGERLYGRTEAESAAMGYGVLREFAAQDNPDSLFSWQVSSGDDDALNGFRTTYLEPFYEYLDEHLDDRQYVLHSLLRYKRVCEWFRREELYSLATSESRHGEREVALRLYEHLYALGLEFTIEPHSASGEADMVAIQDGSNEPLIAEVKLFDPAASRGKPHLIRGFHQVHRYTCDYNEPIGYLVIFNTSERPLRFALKEAADPVPRVLYNHKTIFLVEVDIFPHALPASVLSYKYAE